MKENGFVLAAGSVKLKASECKIPVIYVKEITLVDCPCCVVIIGEGEKIPPVKRALGVIIGDNAEFVSENLSGVQVITCGRCGKNTVSISSSREETLTLSLNRSIRTMYGEVEPLEKPMPRTAAEFDCMAAFAAEILLFGG